MQLLFLFLGLLLAGRIMDELRWSHIALWILVAAVVLIAIAVFQLHSQFYIVALSVMNIALILVIFKGDVEIR